MKNLLLIAVLVGSTTCSSPNLDAAVRVPVRATAAGDCGDTVAHALSSPDALVPNAVSCMTGAALASAQASNIRSDHDLQAIANQPPQYHSHRLVGATQDGAHVYELDGAASDAILVVRLNRSGKITTLGILYPAAP